MTRRNSLLISAALFGIVAALVYSQMARTPDDRQEALRASQSPPDLSRPADGQDSSNLEPAAASPEQTGQYSSFVAADAREPTEISAETIARWITDIESVDPDTRAQAIVALADAPKAQAVPVLKDVLMTGEPQVDRHIALRSLHLIALREGDDDGRIRDTLREAMYHGDDDDVAESAGAFLEDIEVEFAARTKSDRERGPG